MSRHSEMFLRACADTRSAWGATMLPRMVKPEKVELLSRALKSAGARELAGLLVEIAWAPYSGAGGYVALDATQANKLCTLLMASLLLPMVANRSQSGQDIDLRVVKESLVHWIDSGELPPGFDRQAQDLENITRLLGGPEARIALTAPLASPLEFSILALYGDGQQSSLPRESQ
jgi:hypothetical protein